MVNLHNKTIFITGVAGFIGAFLSKKLLENYKNTKIIGLDNLNDYYDVSLKQYRLKKLEKYNNFLFIKGDLSDE